MTRDELAAKLDEILEVTADYVSEGMSHMNSPGGSFTRAMIQHHARLRPALLALLESAAGGGIPGPAEATDGDVEAYIDHLCFDGAADTRDCLNAVFAARRERFGATPATTEPEIKPRVEHERIYLLGGPLANGWADVPIGVIDADITTNATCDGACRISATWRRHRYRRIGKDRWSGHALFDHVSTTDIPATTGPETGS